MVPTAPEAPRAGPGVAGLLAAALLAVPPVPLAAAGEGAFGPAPRDTEGRFFNTAGPLPRAGAGVVFPFFLRRLAGRFRTRPGAPGRVDGEGALLRQGTGSATPWVAWIGHSTLLVRMGGRSFLTDPIWSDTASPLRWLGPRRFVPPGLPFEALPPIDFVLISHGHFDHLDLATLQRLAERGPATRFLVPLGNGRLLREHGIDAVEELDWGGQVRIGPLTVHCLPAQHWSRRGLADFRRALWSSWAVIGPTRRFYFAGDSGTFDGFPRIGAALGPFDLAALPIGAYEPQAMMRPFHLDPEQAVQAARDLRARRVLGVHFGTFDLSDEPLEEPPRRFRAAGARAGIPALDVWVLRIGEVRGF